jgi:hypothetical protein
MSRTVKDTFRTSVMRRDNNTCQAVILGSECGRGPDGEWLTVHHICPKEYGGTNRQTNLLTVCYKHHKRIHTPRFEDLALALGLLQQVETEEPFALCEITDKMQAEIDRLNSWQGYYPKPLTQRLYLKPLIEKPSKQLTESE